MGLTIAKKQFWLSSNIIQKLLASGKLVAYYEATPNNVVLDVNGKVSQFTDLSGNGHHLTQSTAANRPLFDGIDSVEFLLTFSRFLTNSTITASLNGSSIGIFGIIESVTSDMQVVTFADTNGTDFLSLRDASAFGMVWYTLSGQTVNTGIFLNNDGKKQVYGLQINNDTNVDVMENTTITTVTDTTSSIITDLPLIDNMSLGAIIRSVPTYYTYIIQSLYITNTKLTLTELQSLSAYISARKVIYENIFVAELGQSNMFGTQADSGNPLYPFQSGMGREWTGSTDIEITTTRGNSAAGAPTSAGSHANYFCAKYFNLLSKKPIMSCSAVSGTGLTATSTTPNWSSGSTIRGQAITKINAGLAFYGIAAPYCALWCQGESDAITMDANPAYTKAIVKAAMQDVIDWWKLNYPTSPFIISELGRNDTGLPDTTGWADMRDIQNEIVAENSDVYIGFSGAKDFVDTGKMNAGTVHYTYEGYQEMGEALATYIANNL